MSNEDDPHIKANAEVILKVYWAQLSDQSLTPERTQQRLVADDVAGRMKGKSQGEYFQWGKH